MPKIDFEISALGNGAIVDKWIQYGGVRTTEVPAGEAFDILCEIDASGGGRWLEAVTVKSTDGSIKNYEDTLITIDPTGLQHTVVLGNMGANIMPAHDITLTIKVWGVENESVSPPYPPESEW